MSFVQYNPEKPYVAGGGCSVCSGEREPGRGGGMKPSVAVWVKGSVADGVEGVTIPDARRAL